MGKSRAFRRFVKSIDAPIASYEDFQRYSQLDIDALEALDENELREAHDLMIAKLAEGPDDRIARTLSGFDTPEARQSLQDAVERYPNDVWDQGETGAEALLGLCRHGVIEDPASAMADYLERVGPKGRERILAELGSRDDADTGEVLTRALDDDDPDVRQAAGLALFQRLGLSQRASLSGTAEWLATFQLTSPHRSMRAAAHKTLERLAEQVQKGTAPPALTGEPEPSPALDAFRDSLNAEPDDRRWKEDFDLEALTALEGTERDWMEYALITRLDSGDSRVPRALAAMESTLALEPLRELLPSTEGALRLEVEEAIDDLEELA